jgi:hypothetical protein
MYLSKTISEIILVVADERIDSITKQASFGPFPKASKISF